MDHQISFTYLPCQTCSAKIRCDQCSDLVVTSLMQIEGIVNAEVNMVKKQLAVNGAMELGKLEEYLEDLGVFPE